MLRAKFLRPAPSRLLLFRLLPTNLLKPHRRFLVPLPKCSRLVWEQRQARNNGSKFTVLSVATQRSWKNAEDEWVSKVEWHRVAIFRPRLAEAVLNNIKKGAHVLVEGSLVSSTYEQRTAKAKRRRPQRSLRGRFAPMLCASSTAASQNRKRRHPVRMLPCRRPTRAITLRSDASLQRALRRFRGPVLLFYFAGSVRRLPAVGAPLLS